MRNALPDRVRIGAFELDLRGGELRDGERSVWLQEQPLSVLRMLVERNGEIVTRDELKRKLWPNDTIVDFDHSINTAIRKLRQAFGDSADEPKYITTVARRGYRLLVPAEQLSVVSGQLSESSGSSDSSEATGAATVRVRVETGSLIEKKVSHYRVLSVIGSGGMGLVYEAEDLKLGRRVAVKFLPEELAGDPVALQRFEREAQTASSLNHPNICTIHEVEEHESQPFIVMELLEGETLRDRLASRTENRQALPLEQLLDIGMQVCDGLQAAHEKGIIHRDIKPANIFLTSKGVAKILDFGLAKLMVSEEKLELSSRAEVAAAATGAEGPAVRSDRETAGPSTARPPVPQATRDGEERGRSAQDDSVGVEDASLTRTGLAMGTAGYMSPEQVLGEDLDARTDIFSFGLVLYEMATGQRAFSGETAGDVHAAILTQSPLPVRDRNSALPLKLKSIIDRAIEKEREQRYQTAADLRAALQSLAESTEAEADRSRLRSGWKWLAAAAVVCAVLVAGGLYWRSRRVPKLTGQDTIVIADFDNKTGDPVLDETLRQALAIQLGQSPFFNVLPERKVRDTLKLMKRPASEALTESVGREVCVRSNSKAMLIGSISKPDSGYLIGLKAMDCNIGNVITEVQEKAANNQAVLKSLDQAVLAMRAKLGESLSTVERYATPLEQATTPSLEALRAYSLAQKTGLLEGGRAAIPLYERALELDPNFALAYKNLAPFYRNLKQDERANQCSRKAYELREKVSARERLAIEADYYQRVTGELYKALQTYEVWQQSYPGSFGPVENAAVVYWQLGNLEKYLEQTRAAMRLGPTYFVAYENLQDAYTALNRLDEAEEILNQAEQRHLGHGVVNMRRYELAFLKGNDVQMAHLAAVMKGEPGHEDSLPATMADTEAWHGKIKNSRKLSGQAIEIAKRNGSAAIYVAARALTQAPIVPSAQTRADADEAIKLSKDPDIMAFAALAMAIAGDLSSAQKLEVELNEQYPLRTQMQNYWLPSIRAAVALQRKDPNRAIELLKGREPDRTCRDPPTPGSSLFAGRSLSHAPRRRPSGGRISQVYRSLRPCRILHMGRAGPLRPCSCLCARSADRSCLPGESPHRLSEFPHPMEGRRSRRPNLPASQSRVRKAAIVSPS
jgi:serine/threonine protein kinase/tetratricopeptide (TPR) repeat protein